MKHEVHEESTTTAPAATTTILSKQEVIRTLYPNETAIENPPLSDGESTFAACMLVMDDNMRLTEWCTYTRKVELFV